MSDIQTADMQEAAMRIRDTQVAMVFTCEELYLIGTQANMLRQREGQNPNVKRLADAVFANCDSVLQPLYVEELKKVLAEREPVTAANDV